ncbi:MAG: RecQ family ATP-dependent DNA helicase [Fimbriimonadaceae bacterium]
MSVEGDATRILRAALGDDARFRDGQLGAIEAAVSAGTRTLVVQRTGWGKSVVYLVATRLLRDASSGPTVLVSPLLSLMRNQEAFAQRFHVTVVSINSTTRDNRAATLQRIENQEVDLVMVTPEQLGILDFKTETLPLLQRTCRMLVIDEAHCISDWGHDFRPDYRRILDTVHRLSPSASVLGTTATANDRVIRDIQAQLGDVKVVRGPLMRASLHLKVFSLRDQAERLAFLAKYVPRFQGTGIIYALTVNDVRRIAAWLRDHDVEAFEYHADLANDERAELERGFQQNEFKALCATTALGMGYDKGDVGFVIHFQRPGSVIAFYQQVGRAGRAVGRADVVLLEGCEDDEINEYFIASAFPSAGVFEGIKQALANFGPLRLDGVVSHTNFRHNQVQKALHLLEVEHVVEKTREGFQLVDPNWEYSSLRSEEIQAARLEELRQMQEYAKTPLCRMVYLARALDDHHSKDCGKCDRCNPGKTISIDRETVAEAIQFLRADSHVIEQKGFYPPGAIAEGRKKISDDDRLEPGIALSVYNDAGWGMLVRQGKYTSGHYSDELIEPSVTAILRLEHRPKWVTFVPSLDHKDLVSEFAKRLAEALGVPVIDCVRKVKRAAPQKEMQNSTTQFSNAWSAFEVDQRLVIGGTCLLVDDVVDSGWTMTAVGVRLRRAGCSSVVPFALATARPRGQ